jgi:penicillin-binding protein 1B
MKLGLKINIKTKFILKSLLLLIFVSMVAALTYCVVTIQALPPVFKDTSYSGVKNLTDNNDGNGLASDVAIKKRLLKTYYLWGSSPQSFDTWKKSLLKSKKIEIDGQDLITKGDVSLPAMVKNNCDGVFCLQKRITFSNIPGQLWKGLIGIEDYRYLDHKGVDLRSLLRALWHDIKVMRLEQGGSTLTQQLVKNLYYSNERKFSRKIKEMIVSLYLEWKYSKEEILSAYFNEVEWGSFQGIKIKGIYAASLMYFDKKPSFLTDYEVSILIGLLKGPYYYSPFRHADRLRKRANVVFNKLKELGLVSSLSPKWNDKAFSDWVARLKKRSNDVDVYSIWVISNKTINTFSKYTLINEQHKLIKELKKKYPLADWASKVSVWKKINGTYENTYKHYSKVERSQKKAFEEERHQVGSLLKPIVYGLLIDRGLKLDDKVSSKREVFKLKSGNWSPRESHKTETSEVTYLTALMTSMNTPIVRASKEYGYEHIEEGLVKIIPHLYRPLSEYPAQLLGAVEMSINELGHAYQEFIDKSCSQAIRKPLIDALSDPKRTTIRYRVGKSLGQMKFFGKTGTTNSGFSNWFVGHNGDELFIGWVGVENVATVKKRLKVYGSNTSFLLYRNYYENRGQYFSEMACQYTDLYED